MRRPTMSVLTIAMLATLVLAPQTLAEIVPQRSIAGVKIGATERQARAALGTPTRTRTSKDEITGQKMKVLTFGKTTVTLVGGDAVTLIRTSSRRERTSTGVGVGSTESALRAGVRNVNCSSSGKYRFCQVGRSLPGARVTGFVFSPKTRLIKSVSVGRVID